MIKNQTEISELAFFADIFKYMNELNIKLQGNHQFIPNVWSHINSFQIKIKLL